ncbi:hypothetical protein H257_07682 [Aphanomyces astaci]|uniref:AB hydrolase-1 domain-containing protein n=1 Tax=Aphanomyces astaci TaxID=112090 RepID=W4GIK3_APHAT|nr:hypothetical protein H257_07682 [Aphanomyces astaci]ETV78869.1 hypothetical protein H257_07682 [Aphanomyces astaci]|eukprot:XP_009831588.1 hypothetical protein H257_07682 [Aphanomyces astaci]
MPKSNVPPRPDDPSYNHQFATVNGIRMHYVDVGPRGMSPPSPIAHRPVDGLILVLVHGGPTCGMDGGYERRPLYNPDNCGFGDTESPLSPASYSRKNIATDYACFLDHLAIDRVVFIGRPRLGRRRGVAHVSVLPPPPPAVTKVPASVLDEDVADMLRVHILPFFRLMFGTPIVRDYGSLYDNMKHLPTLEFTAASSSSYP